MEVSNKMRNSCLHPPFPDNTWHVPHPLPHPQKHFLLKFAHDLKLTFPRFLRELPTYTFGWPISNPPTHHHHPKTPPSFPTHTNTTVSHLGSFTFSEKFRACILFVSGKTQERRGQVWLWGVRVSVAGGLMHLQTPAGVSLLLSRNHPKFESFLPCVRSGPIPHAGKKT